MEAVTLKIAVKGIEITLLFDHRTAELYHHNVAAVLKQNPSGIIEFATQLGLSTLVYCGYYMHCKDTDMPLIFSIEDFTAWAIQQAATPNGIACITNINNVYLKLVEG